MPGFLLGTLCSISVFFKNHKCFSWQTVTDLGPEPDKSNRQTGSAENSSAQGSKTPSIPFLSTIIA